jgi:fermentation-respiration switch protein FrsA (DUF1100 family)
VRTGGTPELADQSSAIDREFYDFYRTSRGNSPDTTTHPTMTSNVKFSELLPLQRHRDDLATTLCCSSRGQTPAPSSSAGRLRPRRRAKELVIIPGAGHVDLYDRVNLIPFDKLTGFFQNSLRNG